MVVTPVPARPGRGDCHQSHSLRRARGAFSAERGPRSFSASVAVQTPSPALRSRFFRQPRLPRLPAFRRRKALPAARLLYRGARGIRRFYPGDPGRGTIPDVFPEGAASHPQGLIVRSSTPASILISPLPAYNTSAAIWPQIASLPRSSGKNPCDPIPAKPTITKNR